MQTTQKVGGGSVPIRKVRHDFEGIPDDWHSGSVLASAIADGVNLLFPSGERFFVRSVKRFESEIDDPELLAQMRGFYGQEGSHAREHERYFDILRGRGHDLDAFLDRFERVTRFVEGQTPASWSLAATAAAEHYTAIMAYYALTDGTLDNAHPAMRDLISWHAAEEIEHKAVAFDVLKQVDPRYSTRVIGLAVATLFLTTHWTMGTTMLLRQNKVGLRTLLKEVRAARQDPARNEKSIARGVFLKGILSYLRRDFHPWDEANLDDAERYLATRDDLQTRAA